MEKREERGVDRRIIRKHYQMLLKNRNPKQQTEDKKLNGNWQLHRNWATRGASECDTGSLIHSFTLDRPKVNENITLKWSNIK